MMIMQNIIHNFPVMVEYIDISEKIFGPDVSTLKVRTTGKVQKWLWRFLSKYQDNLLRITRSLLCALPLCSSINMHC